MNREHLAVLAALLTMCCVLPYLRDIYRGDTRPQRVSWLVFAALSAVAAISQAFAGSTSGSWLATGSAIGFCAVFVASIPRGEGGFAPSEIVVLAIALTGTVISIVIAQPLIAVLGVVIAEIGAVALTVRKTIDDPESETRSTWVVDGFAGVLSIAAVSEPSVAALIYPVHHTLANGAVVAAIAVGHRRLIPGYA